MNKTLCRSLEEQDKLNEHKRNILHRYCRKVEYYEEIGYSSKQAIYKAKEFYGMLKRNKNAS